MSYRINVGDAIPDFNAKDELGETFSTEDLLGTPAVIYFYPKDDTPGCTQEACAFRDNMKRLEKKDIIVIGISPDNANTHQKFIEKYSLNYSLIPDEKMELCRKFDVIREQKMGDSLKMNVERTTFLVDRDGIIQWIERPVTIEGHVDRILEAIETYED
jgi:thioredoxin-dependent peroxiredoxin